MTMETDKDWEIIISDHRTGSEGSRKEIFVKPHREC